MDEENRKTELLVGLFLFVGLALLGVLILQFSSVKESLKEKYQITLNFPSADGLVQGAPVKLGGATIGEIATRPRLNSTFNGATIDLEIYADFQIPENSIFQIGSSGLMGDKLLEITPPPPEEITGNFVSAGAVITGGGPSGFDAIEDAALRISAQTQVVLKDVQVALKTLTGAIQKVDDGFLDEENAKLFKETLTKLSEAVGKVDQGLLADENLTNFSETLTDLRAAAANIKDGSSEFSPALAKIGPAIDKLNPSLGKLEGVVDKLGTTADAITAAADTAQSTLSGATTGDGLLPALLEDPKVKAEFSGLISNLKRHGVLGYKDSAPGYTAPDEEGGTEGTQPRGTNREASRPRGRWPWNR